MTFQEFAEEHPWYHKKRIRGYQWLFFELSGKSPEDFLSFFQTECLDWIETCNLLLSGMKTSPTKLIDQKELMYYFGSEVGKDENERKKVKFGIYFLIAILLSFFKMGWPCF